MKTLLLRATNRSNSQRCTASAKSERWRRSTNTSGSISRLEIFRSRRSMEVSSQGNSNQTRVCCRRCGAARKVTISAASARANSRGGHDGPTILHFFNNNQLLVPEGLLQHANALAPTRLRRFGIVRKSSFKILRSHLFRTREGMHASFVLE